MPHQEKRNVTTGINKQKGWSHGGWDAFPGRGTECLITEICRGGGGSWGGSGGALGWVGVLPRAFINEG